MKLFEIYSFHYIKCVEKIVLYVFSKEGWGKGRLRVLNTLRKDGVIY
jgi:hypothetical protein